MQCPLSILRKGNVPCHYFVFLSVDFKRVQCRLSNLREGCVALSNLRVKGPHGDPPAVGQAFDGKGESVRTLLTNPWPIH